MGKYAFTAMRGCGLYFNDLPGFRDATSCFSSDQVRSDIAVFLRYTTWA